MSDPRTPVFEAIRAISPAGVFNAPGNMIAVHNLLDGLGARREAEPAVITPRVLAEIVAHEAIVCEAYRDSKGIWTWGVGVTSASGHDVDRYKDAPQTLTRCLEVFAWLLREKYLPDVLKAFGNRRLTEAQLAAALSFHYNTGAILRATWVRLWLENDQVGARQQFLAWRQPPEIVGRRTRERDLFFGGAWSADGKATVWPVKKPGYTPDWSKPQRVDITAALAELAA